MEMSQRVLFVTKNPAYGGVEAVTISLLGEIDYGRNSVVLATVYDVFSGPISRLGLPVTVVPLSARLAGWPTTVFFSWVRFLRRLRPGKVILTEINFPLPAVLAARMVTGGQVYLMRHLDVPPPPTASRKHWGFVPGIGLWWYRRALAARLGGRLAKKTIAVGTGIRDNLVRYYGFSAAKTSAVQNGVDVRLFSPASDECRRAERAALAIPEDATVIVSTARLHADKRVERLIYAFGALRAAGADLWLLMAGDGPERGKLETAVRSVGHDGRVKFLGHLEDIRAALHAADIYVLPSDVEGLPLALLEAMACGLVCIATDIVGAKEVIQEGETGFLVDRTGEGVLEGLRKTLALRLGDRQRMGIEARKAVVERFSLARAVAQGLESLGIEQVKRGASAPGLGS